MRSTPSPRRHARRLWLAVLAALLLATLPRATVRADAPTAAITNYAFAATGGTFTPLSGGTSVSAIQTDDAVSGALPLGFDFWFMGTRYSQVYASSNGFLSFNSSATSSNGNNLSSGSARPLVAPLWDDLDGGGSIGTASYQTSGSPGSRVFTFEWLNWQWNYTANIAVVSMQVKLYEGTGQVEFVYRQEVGTPTAASASIGLAATATGSGNFLSLNDASASPTVSSTSETTTIATKPATGQSYSFTPPLPAAPTNLTFSGVGVSAMTLNWTDNASDEEGYVIYRSTDGITYTFVGQTAANATSSVQSGLAPNTLYYWQLYAVTEGGLSAALSGSQSTGAPSLSGTRAVGPTGDYASLTQAIADINASGLAGALVLELQAAYVSSVEPAFPVVVPPLVGASATNTVTIRPEVGATGLAITSSASGGTIDLNGADYVTFDGRPGGVGTAKELTIENSYTISSASNFAIRFTNDASNNALQYLTIRSAQPSPTSGAVLFSSLSGTTGNDNNLVDFCDLRDSASGTPANLIYSTGLSSIENSSNTVSNNNFFNFFRPSTDDAAGIRLQAGTAAWTISGNSFYQTVARVGTGGTTARGIYTVGAGNGFVIINNAIGGSAPNAGGTPWTVSGSFANRFEGIRLSVGTTTASSVQGNTITNFTWSSTSGATGLPGVWIGIYTTAGSSNIGTTTPNVVGATTGTGAVTVTTSTSGGLSFGIGLDSTATVAASNNVVGAITTLGSTTGVSHSFTGIQATFGTNTISGNTVGNATTANSINASTASTATLAQSVTGIGTSSSSSTTISNNLVANLNNNYVGTSFSSQTRGIVASAGVNTISGNTVRNLSTSAPNTNTGSSASLVGISQSATSTGGQSVSQNTVHSLSNTAASAAVQGVGIYYNGPTSGTNLVARNFVHSLRLTTSSTGASLYGINASGGTTTYQNNMVRLGIDAAGASLTTGYAIFGLYDFLGTNNYYFNTSYVGGTGVASSANTFALNSGVTFNTRNFKNNILVNARSNGSGTATNAAALLSGTLPNATGLDSNYNLYFAPGAGGTLIRHSSTNYATLAAWQAASGEDANSVTGDPLLANPTGTAATVDLHIVPGTGYDPVSPASRAGTPIAGILNDWDGDTRDATRPDIGADEFLVNRTLSGAGTLPGGNFDTITVDGTATATAGGNLNVVTLTVDAGGVLAMGTNVLTSDTTTNNGQITADPPLDNPDTSPPATYNGPEGTVNVELTTTAGSLGPTEVDILLANTFPAGGFGTTCPTVTDAVRRYYNITPANTGGTATVRLYYNDTAYELNGNVESDLQIWHCNGTTWTNLGSTARDTTANWVELLGVSVFSPFLLHDSSPLSVDLASFSAEAQSDHIRVTWETVSELDNAGFNLHRGLSADGPTEQLNPTLIPSQAPGSGQGFPYEWLDRDVQPGTPYFYWLDAVDLNGNATRYGPVSATMQPPTAVTLNALRAEPDLTRFGNLSDLTLGVATLLLAGLALVRYRRRAR